MNNLCGRSAGLGLAISQSGRFRGIGSAKTAGLTRWSVRNLPRMCLFSWVVFRKHRSKWLERFDRIAPNLHRSLTAFSNCWKNRAIKIPHNPHSQTWCQHAPPTSHHQSILAMSILSSLLSSMESIPFQIFISTSRTSIGFLERLLPLKPSQTNQYDNARVTVLQSPMVVGLRRNALRDFGLIRSQKVEYTIICNGIVCTHEYGAFGVGQCCCWECPGVVSTGITDTKWETGESRSHYVDGSEYTSRIELSGITSQSKINVFWWQVSVWNIVGRRRGIWLKGRGKEAIVSLSSFLVLKMRGDGVYSRFYRREENSSENWWQAWRSFEIAFLRRPITSAKFRAKETKNKE
jgi:hypothetical protein